MSNGKEIWEDFGVSDAYYSVSTFDKFRSGRIDDEARADFFASGREHLDLIWSVFERHFGAFDTPKNAIDIGCGVGRVLLPLAERCEWATGVDISTAMLAEARRNADGQGVENIRLIETDEFLRDADARYDLVHTFIVMQHVEPQIGYWMIEKMLESLTDGGRAMIHTVFQDSSPFARKLRFRIYRAVPAVHKFLNWIRGKTERFMPMYEYDRQAITTLFDKHGCRVIDTIDTDHGFAGTMFFIEKGTQTPSSASVDRERRTDEDVQAQF